MYLGTEQYCPKLHEPMHTTATRGEKKGPQSLASEGTDDHESQHYASLLGLQGQLQTSASNREGL